jgi:hypothetical protein
MRHLTAVALFLSLVSTAASAQTKPNFSGTWILDLARSSVTPRAELEPETLVVAQTDKELRFQRQVADERTTQVVLFDYPTATGTGSTGGITGIRASWKDERLILTGWAETPASRRSRSANKSRPSPLPSLDPSSVPRAEPMSILSWSLENGGQTLTIQGLAFRVWTEPGGDRVTEELRAKWVYKKQ